MQRIVRWDTGAVIWEGDAGSVKDAIHAANLALADLSRADLAGANLSRAYLSRADLAGADLAGANLSRAYLSRANLAGADLAGANLAGANLAGANLSRAYLSRATSRRADLAGANLAGANLAGANLAGADLAGAHLSGANLAGANLSRAYLSGAYLSRAAGLQPSRVQPLLILLDQTGPIRAYKLVNQQWEGHINGGLKYAIGEMVSVDNASTDVSEMCGAGIHVATLDWVLRDYQPGYRVLIVEFTAADIAAIPTASDGKFRLHRCTVIGEKDLTGLIG